jgi:hypothetical protein
VTRYRISHIKQKAEPVFDLCNSGMRNSTPSLYKPLFGDGAYILTHDETCLLDPAFGGIYLDMQWDIPLSGSERYDHNESGWTLIELIC